ncbi:MAG: leucyl/phenylalanyl-tRNA--protein transferase [candidate division KSB1 bacterium]|nr:leucyl/phenylalanyl-tRNA--protein transferase [candidate division KSB1 bacterium]MDQ7065564.1 leucyl/phenylalanyl-tRNA--protein transferase [candidate division KSB1 bacterium]
MRANLSVETLITAYSRGIFPMADADGEVRWYEADPRGILPLDAIHIPHDLKRLLRQNRFRVTLDQDFEAVIRACADRPEPTWISEEIIEAYLRLHHAGYAHSVETWRDDRLAGGLYGVALGAAFFGESMFYRQRDASKVALVHLAFWLKKCDFKLLDIQMVTDVLRRFGAVHISKQDYLDRLHKAIYLQRHLRAVPIDWKHELAPSSP